MRRKRVQPLTVRLMSRGSRIAVNLALIALCLLFWYGAWQAFCNLSVYAQ